MKLLFTLLLSSQAFAMDCANFAGDYLMDDEFNVQVIQNSCDTVTIKHEVGSETLVVDGIERTTEDYDGNLLITKTAWSADRKEIVITSKVIILQRELFSTTESYVLLPDGSLKWVSVEQFESGAPRTLTYVYTRK